MTHATTRIWHDKLHQATETAAHATKLEFSKSYSEAFEAYVRAGQLYLWLVRNFHDRRPPDHDLAGTRRDGAALLSSSLNGRLSLDLSESEMRDRLKRSAFKVMERAEKIKSVRQDVRPVDRLALSYEEQSNALSASARIGGLTFPIWTDPTAADFEAASELYVDPDPQPALSPTQLKHKASYRRASRRSIAAGHSDGPDAGGFGRRLRGRDIVQDIVTDCSFVAALEVAAAHDRRWGTKLATSALYPKDSSGSIRQSANGKYMARISVNGAARRVTFDDSLPCYPDGKLMCATSREGQQTWPALLEKAYLKIMGGYDFLGSNSSIDLHALTGWIPEHVFVRHAGFQREKTWTRIMDAWAKGACMITAGTGNFREDRSPTHDGLVPSHDYAVLSLIERSSRRYALLMNPWSRAIGKRPGLAVPLDEERSILALEERQASNGDGDGESGGGGGGFLVSWDDLCGHFDSLYLNWDPARFRHQLSVHSTWKGVSSASPAHAQSVGQNPQFRLSLEPDEAAERGGAGAAAAAETEVWLLLVRHIEGKQSLAPTDEGDYMALHVFEHEDRHRVYKPRDTKRLGSYVDGTHNLVHLKKGPAGPEGGRKAAYTVVVSRHGPSRNVSYSLSAYSSARLSLCELPHAYPYHEKVSGSWSGRSAGGNVTHPTFMNNPQFAISVSPPASCNATSPTPSLSKGSGTASLLLLLESSRSLPIQAQLVWSTGGRITHCVEGDIAMSSGIYNHGIAVAERTSLQPGTYTLILSTFEPGQSGPFVVSAESSTPLSIRPIPQEGAGMYSRTIRGTWKRGSTAGGPPSAGSYDANPRYRIRLVKDATLQARIKATPSTIQGGERHRPYINIALFRDEREGRRGREVATSGPYVDHVCGAAIEATRLVAGEYVVVASTYSKGTEADFTVDVYLDWPIELAEIK